MHSELHRCLQLLGQLHYLLLHGGEVPGGFLGFVAFVDTGSLLLLLSDVGEEEELESDGFCG